jgi:transposase
VDDWAVRKGRSYGTILVDLEQHQVVDLLPDRTSETLSTWLREHPGVEILTRDRSTEYAKGASEGTPTAQQVADRWHLLLNVRQMLERYLPGVYGRLKQLPNAPAVALESDVSRRMSAYRRTKAEVVASQESREERLARYEEVKRYYQEGKSLSAISQELALNIKTVRRYASAHTFPERSKRTGPSILDPYLVYLKTRHQEGCENASQLWREIQQEGFPGSKRQVLKWMREQRLTPAPTTPGRYVEGVREEKRTAVRKNTGSTTRLPSAKQLAWLFVQEPSTLQKVDAETLSHVRQDAEVARVYEVARTFVDMVRQKQPMELDPWLETCAESSVKALRTFAAGIKQDYEAVRSALELPWSNAQTEGQVTRLKFIKRQMYGRAKFDLLRQRVLLAA